MLPVWKLIGFVLYVVLYYSVLNVNTAWPPESIKTVFFKVMPVIHLMFVVTSTSMEEDVKVKSSRYRWSVVFALMACAVGDCCQVFAEYFYHSVIMFGIAHLLYIRAFGICPLGSGPVAASFAVLTVAYYFFLVHGLQWLFMKLIGVTNLLLLFVMAWRSVVVWLAEKSSVSFLACLGSLLFIVADAMFIVDKFYGSFSQAPFWIMLTYYAAQLGVALSACDTYTQSLLEKYD